MKNKSLGETLKEYRIKKFGDEVLRKVGENVGVNYTNIHRIEDNKHIPTDETLWILMEKYDVPADERVHIILLAHHSEVFEKVVGKVSHKVAAEAFNRRIKK